MTARWPYRVVAVALVGMVNALPVGRGGTEAHAAGVRATVAGACPQGETGLQGEVPLADQLSGRSKQGYRCGLDLIGQNDIRHRGANMQLAWLGNCAYVGTADLPRLGVARYLVDPPADAPLWGIAVIDASDDTHPRLVRVLHSPATFNTWEALHTNDRRGILAVSGTGNRLDVYDASADCTNPILRSSFTLDVASHGMLIAPDGNTVYTGLAPSWTAVDIGDLDHPHTVLTFDQGGHDIDLSPDGTRMYMAVSGSGLSIFDVSDIQFRRANPEVRTLSTVDWNDIGNSVRLAHIAGRTYAITEDEMNSHGADAAGAVFPAALNCPWGYVRIVDVTDELQPNLVSTFSLAVNDAAHCAETLRDASLAPAVSTVLYSTHYMGVDNPDNTTTAFFTWFGAGLRMVDIRDPAHPREIAYYNPPARAHTVFARRSFIGPPPRTFDLSTSYVRYRPQSHDIWFVSVANGFQILRAA